MNLRLKKLTYTACAIAMGLVLSGCGSRIVPDELVLIKYSPLEMPSALTLPTPDKNATHLGYKSARNTLSEVVKKGVETSTVPAVQNATASPSILKLLRLASVDMQVLSSLKNPMGQRVVVIIDEEQKRLAKNIADNLPLSTGKVPKILAKKTRAGIDELFGD